MNVASFVINIVIGLWLVPYLVGQVGVAAYGLIPLAMVFTEFMGVITVSINGTISRFLTIDIQNSNWAGANQTFNTAFFALVAIIIIQLPILGYIIYDLSSIINVPLSLERDTVYLFVFTFCGYFLTLFSTSLNTSMYAKNRLDLSRLVDIVKIITRVATIVLLFSFIEPNLKFVGLANFFSGFCTLLVSFFYWQRLTPNLSISIFHFQKKKFLELIKMGGWLSLNMVGYLLFLKIDIFVINKFIGPEESGEYSAILQWNVLIRTFATILAGVIGPMILISFAKKEMDRVVQFAQQGVKLLTVAIGVTAGTICGIAAPVIEIWLGPHFTHLSILLVIMLCTLPINLGILPLFSINNALNKVKIPGLMTIAMGLVNLILAVLAVTTLNMGFIGVAIAGALTLTLKNAIFTPWYSAKILGLNSGYFFKSLFAGVILFAITFLPTKLLLNFFDLNIIWSILLPCLIIAPLSLILCWNWIFNESEKITMYSVIPLQLKQLIENRF